MPRAIMIVGLGNGDEGKGSLVDHLVRKEGIRKVVRFNGGAQAMHHVVTRDVVHGFSQFGAGTFAGAETVLSRFMLFEPLAFSREAYTLAHKGISDPYSLVTISSRAPIITPANILANRILEISRGAGRHGSCGLGIGLTQGDVEELGEQAVYAGDLLHPAVLREKLSLVWQRRLDTVREFENEASYALCTQLRAYDIEDLIAFYGEFARRIQVVPDSEILEILAREDTIFEGAQGVLLDQRWGFFPYVTRSNSTFQNAETLLQEAGGDQKPLRIGLLRGYATRHGAGPFPTENDALSVPPCHNETNPWQGAFRIGWFDAVAARYALEVVGGVDLLSLTNLDRLIGLDRLKAAVAYQDNTYFPNGMIPHVSPDKVELEQRTRALIQTHPDYELLPSIQSACSKDLFHYADAISQHIGQEINLLSASADQHKIYRGNNGIPNY